MFSCRTPFTPPTTEEDELSILRLVRSRRVGATTFHRLLAEHGSARAALGALPDLARAAGVSDYEACPEGVARAELATGKRAGARLLLHGGPGYPEALLPLADAPAVLWAMGDMSLLNRPMIAVIGARNASSLGLRMARRLAAELGAHGIVVVSGLARGIDAAAHDAALETGTIGVQAGGIDVIYPAENTELAQKMAHRGLRLAELPPGHEPRAQHFPQRNRIIAGLGCATVVVEAAARSGSLLTARMALDYGREVLAVPGHPLDARAAGCNMLLRDGAVLIRGIDDITEALSLAAPPAPAHPPPAQPCAPQRPPARAAAPPAPETPAAILDPDVLMERVMQALGPQPMHEEELLRSQCCEAAALTRLLVELEIEGLVERHPGGMISRL